MLKLQDRSRDQESGKNLKERNVASVEKQKWYDMKEVKTGFREQETPYDGADGPMIRKASATLCFPSSILSSNTHIRETEKPFQTLGSNK